MSNRFWKVLAVAVWAHLFYRAYHVAPPTMFEALAYRFGAMLFWTGFMPKSLGTDFVQGLIRDKPHLEATFYSDIEVWNECAPLFQRRVLQKLDLKSGLSADDYYLFKSAIECMEFGGKHDDVIISALNELWPLDDFQRADIEHLRKLLHFKLKMKSQLEESIDLALELCETLKYSENVDNPHFYVRYGRIALLLPLLFLFYQMKTVLTKGQSFQLLVILAGSIKGKDGDPLMIIIMLHILVYGMGWRVYVVLLAFVGGLFLDSEYNNAHSQVGRLLMFGEAYLSPTSLERARQLFLLYPYHSSDLKDREALHLVTHIIQVEGWKCTWIPEACGTANRAARIAIEMMEDDGMEDGRDAAHATIAVGLNNAGFPPIPTHLVNASIEEQNYYRAHQGLN